MALTIATGFVVDDAIVMIENIARYIEDGEPPLAGRAQGLGADRLHDHLADRLADRGADPAAVHGRRRRPAVPRVRGHARGHDPDLGGRVADADADDVRAGCCAREPRRTARARLRALARRSAFDARDRPLRPRAATGCSTTSALTLLVARRDARAHRAALRRDPEGLLPGAGHRPDPGASPRRRSRVSFARDGASASRRWRDAILAGSRRREPVARSSASTAPTPTLQQRPHADQPEAARRARRQRQRRSSAGCSASVAQRRRHHALPAAGAGPDDRRRRSSRTQYQFVARRRRTATSSRRGRRGWSTALHERARSSRDVASDASDAGPRGVSSTIDRDTAARLGDHRRRRSTTRSTTRSASASSRRSSPQSNQYRVILEAQPELREHAAGARAQLYLPPRAPAQPVPLSAHRHDPRAAPRRCRSPTSAQFPAATISLQPRARRRRSAHAVDAIRAGRSRTSACRPSMHDDASRARRGAFQASLANELLLILAAIVTRLHRARRALRELHPPDHDPVDAAVGRRRRAARADASPATTSA